MTKTSAVEFSPTLIELVKSHVNVTWNDGATNAKILDEMRMVAAYINKKNGSPADFESAGLPQILLKEGVRYMRDSAFEVFENNYRSMILAVQNEKAVIDYVESTTAPEA